MEGKKGIDLVETYQKDDPAHEATAGDARQKAEAVTGFQPTRANRTLPRMGVYRVPWPSQMNQPVDVQTPAGFSCDFGCCPNWDTRGGELGHNEKPGARAGLIANTRYVVTIRQPMRKFSGRSV